MTTRGARRQMSASAERSGVGQGEALSDPVSDEAQRPRHETESTGPGLLMAVLARDNMQQAWKRVRANKGAAGIDGLDIDQTAGRLRTEWSAIREQLLSGTYRPQPVRRVTIAKPEGGERELGIPTVTDRLIQQALLQVLQPMLDPTFSQHSYGFRPGRNAHQAVLAAQSFVRYADDANVYVRSRRAGERVMALLLGLYGRLQLTVNGAKSAVASAFQRKFLGYSFWVAAGGKIKRRVADKATAAFKQRVRVLTRRCGGRSLQEVVKQLRVYVLGWKAYFRLADTPGVWKALDEWVRHRLRAIQLKQWKRGTTAYREVLKMGATSAVAAQVAGNTRRWWRTSRLLLNSVLDLKWADQLGIPRLC